jgi:hypothetical protein
MKNMKAKIALFLSYIKLSNSQTTEQESKNTVIAFANKYIVLITICCFVFVVLVLVITILLCYRYKKQTKAKADSGMLNNFQEVYVSKMSQELSTIKKIRKMPTKGIAFDSDSEKDSPYVPPIQGKQEIAFNELDVSFKNICGSKTSMYIFT